MLLAGVLAGGICVAASAVSSRMSSQMQTEAVRSTEQAIRRAAVQCYALEGAYPTSVAYLQDKYGVMIDEKTIYVDYFYIAANLAPDITVLARE